MRQSDYADKKDSVLKRIQEVHESPTVRELAEHFEVAPATMHSWLTKLKTDGLVTWEQGRHRSLRLSRKGSRALSSLAKSSS